MAALFCSQLHWLLWWACVLVFVVGAGYIVFKSFQKIPANPPHKGILTFFGRRQEEVLNEGLNFLPGFPKIFGFIPVKVVKVVQKMVPHVVRTPDNAEISVETSITFIPGINKCPKSYIDYQNSGGEEGVKAILANTSEDGLKGWAGSNQWGPSWWGEALTLKFEVHGVLAKIIFGECLKSVNNPIPTTAWIKYFAVPQLEPSDYDVASGWASKEVKVLPNGRKRTRFSWKKLKKILDEHLARGEWKDLKKDVEIRREQIRQLREGRAEFALESLGITVIQFTVNDVKLVGEAAKAAESAEKERLQKVAEEIEVDNVKKRIRQLLDEFPNMTLEQAINIVQVERGKVSKRVLSLEGIREVAEQVFSALGKFAGSPPANPPVPTP
jgi:hypothetical protein